MEFDLIRKRVTWIGDFKGGAGEHEQGVSEGDDPFAVQVTARVRAAAKQAIYPHPFGEPLLLFQHLWCGV